jgi:Putative GTPase activating protein for Arf
MSGPSAAAEAAVKKLARMGGNTICPNCGTEKKFGFGSVCIKFLTFVCNECKSSHQAISHRCKSLTMSSWTDGEVLQLRTIGGNDCARATWLATTTGQNGRPITGSSMESELPAGSKTTFCDEKRRDQYRTKKYLGTLRQRTGLPQM